MPKSNQSDEKYSNEEGTVLKSMIWGDDPSEEEVDSFRLLWTERAKEWIAIYKLRLTVCTTVGD